LDDKNTDIENQLALAGTVCEAGGVYPDSLDDDFSDNRDNSSSSVLPWVWELVIVIIAGISSLVALLWAYRHWGRGTQCVTLSLTAPFVIITNSGKHSKQMDWDADATSPAIPDIVLVDSRMEEHADVIQEAVERAEGRSLWDRWECSKALMFDPRMPLWLRVCVPIMVCGTMALFIDSNMTKDAVSVMLQIDIGKKTISPGSIFDFGLANTVQDMWDAKAR